MSDTNKRRIVLVTGGTKGIGKEIAIKFAEHGDQVIITYGWGSIEEEDIINEFKSKGLPAPVLKQADVVNNEDTLELLNEIKTKFGKLEFPYLNSLTDVTKNGSWYLEMMMDTFTFLGLHQKSLVFGHMIKLILLILVASRVVK